MRVDENGAAWETVLDVVSLGTSVVEFCINPYDLGNLLGLAGDIIDLIPVVTCVGETIRAAKLGRKALEAADDLHDVTKAIDKFGDTAEAIDGTIDTYKALKKNGFQYRKRSSSYSRKKNGRRVRF